MNQEHPQEQPSNAGAEKKQPSLLHLVLNAVIGLLLIVVGYFSYAFLTRDTKPSEELTPQKPTHVVQLDVLNGCGEKKIASKFTNYLRANGFDVVESKNYKTFSVPQTLVVDRVGDLATARRVAAALGVSEKHVVQQINPDYFVDVSVIIGGDFASLRASH